VPDTPSFRGARIGIGRGLTASPLPHHRTFGSRRRRFGGFSQGEPSPQPEHWVPACQPRVHPRGRARSPAPRRMPSRRSTTGHASSPPFRPSARSRGGSASLCPRLAALGCLTSLACAGPTMPSADCCGAVREDSSALSPCQDTPQISRGTLPYRPGRDAGLIKPAPAGDGGLCGGVPPRPAPSCHAAFRPHLAVTPWRFPGPAAPRIPGRGTFTPKHDTMHGTHAGPEPRRSRRRLQALVRRGPGKLCGSHLRMVPGA
jgi:hypothetical protein